MTRRAPWAGALTLALAALVWAWRKPLRDVDWWFDDTPESWGWPR